MGFLSGFLSVFCTDVQKVNPAGYSRVTRRNQKLNVVLARKRDKRVTVGDACVLCW